MPAPVAGGSFVLLVSGLSIGLPDAQPLWSQLLVEFLAGHLGSEQDMYAASRIARVVVCGNSVAQAGDVATGVRLDVYAHTRTHTSKRAHTDARARAHTHTHMH